MQTTGKITDIAIDYNTRKPKISLILDTNQLDITEQLKNENKLSIEIKKWHKKRSFNSNSYLWIMCQKIAECLKTTKEDVYKDLIKNAGQFDFVLVKDEAVEMFIKGWEIQGLGFIAEKQETSKIEGCTKILLYYGSHLYDSKSFSHILDILVQEAKELKIETLDDIKLNEFIKEREKNND